MNDNLDRNLMMRSEYTWIESGKVGAGTCNKGS